MSKYFNYSVCKSCGGMCCKKIAGIYIPEDFSFKITTGSILMLLVLGKFAVDWWEGDLTGNNSGVSYYIRPRHKKQAAVYGSHSGHHCINFTQEKGCSLPKKRRPYQCRMLIPNDHLCSHLDKDKASKLDCAIRWVPYQKAIRDAIELYKND